MILLINTSADWPPPNYHKTARIFPQISWALQTSQQKVHINKVSTIKKQRYFQLLNKTY